MPNPAMDSQLERRTGDALQALSSDSLDAFGEMSSKVGDDGMSALRTLLEPYLSTSEDESSE